MNTTIIIVGHVGKAPEQINLADGKSLVKFGLAVNEKVKGEDKTQWYTVEAWNGSGENVLKYVTSGREVQVIGRLSLKMYKGKDGESHIDPVISLSTFHLCGKKPESVESTDADEGVEQAKKGRKLRSV